MLLDYFFHLSFQLFISHTNSSYAWATCDATTIKTKCSNKFSQWYSVEITYTSLE